MFDAGNDSSRVRGPLFPLLLLLAAALALAALRVSVPAAVEASEPTVLPTIKCAAATDCVPYVGETLHADVTGIPDAYGLTDVDVDYGYQWMANDGGADADIGGATTSTYTLTAAEEGKTVKVRVSFTDAVGNDETLTSAATVPVTVQDPPVAGAVEFYIVEGRAGDGGGGQFVSANSHAISEGLSFYYYMKLRERPSANVTVVPVNSSSAVRVNTGFDGPLIFTPSNWSQRQFVQIFTYPGAADDEDAGSITHTVSSDDSAYDGLTPSFAANIVGTNSECTPPAAPTLTVSVRSAASDSDDSGTGFSMRVAPDSEGVASCGGTPIVGYDTAIQRDDGAWQYSANTRWAVPSAATSSVNPVVHAYGVSQGSTYRVKIRGITYQEGATPWSQVAEVTVQTPGGL